MNAPENEDFMPANSSLCDLFGDLVVYRDLNPVDQRLPRFEAVAAEIGLFDTSRPRKHEPSYAQTMAWFLQRAREIDRPETIIQELVYLGDTVLSDGNAFRNLRSAGAWRGWAFIGAEKDEALTIAEQDDIYTANRWTALVSFVSWILNQGAALDAHTAVIIDIDKTALGARGRNDSAIDRARVTAIEATVAEALGPAFDAASFRRAYVELNQAQVPLLHCRQPGLPGLHLFDAQCRHLDPGRSAGGYRHGSTRQHAGSDGAGGRSAEPAAISGSERTPRRHLRARGGRRPDAVQGLPATRISRDHGKDGQSARRCSAGPAASRGNMPDPRGHGAGSWFRA
jgi:hypothetical protein